MTQHRQIEFKAIAANYLWFRHPLDPLGPDHTGELKGDMSFNYDYERLPDDIWLLHLDAGLRLAPVAHILTRTTFQMVFEGPLTVLLKVEAIHQCVEIALKNAEQGMREQCGAHGIEKPFTIAPDPERIPSFVSTMRTSYENFREPEETPLLIGDFSFTPGTKIMFLLKVPFMVMDEVFFTGTLGDAEHNGAELFKVIPQACYYTVKLRAMTIDKGNVSFKLLQAMCFMVCLDCTLQLMMGDHGDTIEALLRKKGMTDEHIAVFIRTGTDYFNSWNTSDYGKKVRLINFEKRPEWNRVLKIY